MLASGTTTPNPTELLASRQFDRLVKGLEDQYDVLVFDSPPVLGLADSVIIAQKVEAVLYAVSCGKTTTDMVRSSINRMRVANAPLIGTLMTNFDLDNPDYNYYGAYYYSRMGEEEDQVEEAQEELAKTPVT